jgi:Holliday junction resolvase RusA-like endonuclease
MTALAFTVPGDVRGKGRPRIVRIRGFSRLAADKKTAAYENLVALAAREAMGLSPLMEGPVCMTMTARFQPPRSAPRRTFAAMLSGEVAPTKKPDLDNLAKIMDALNGVVWRDDAQVVSLFIRKLYAATPGLDVVIRPYLAPATLGCETGRAAA